MSPTTVVVRKVGVGRLLLVLLLVLWLFWRYFIAPALEAVDRVTPWNGIVPGSCVAQSRPAGFSGMANDAGLALRRLAEGPPSGAQMVAWAESLGRETKTVAVAFEDGKGGRRLLPLAPTPPDVAVPVSTAPPTAVEYAQALLAAGATGEEATRLVMVAGAETTMGADLVNDTSSARGPWQIMTSVHRVSEQTAMDPVLAAPIALRLAREPRGLERHWAQTWGAGRTAPYETQARQAVAAASQGLAAAPAACGPGQGPQATWAGVGGPADGWRNGYLPDNALAQVPGGQLRADAAPDFLRLRQAFAAEIGRPLELTSGYRSYGEQAALKVAKPSLAAKAGGSNHGLGIAIDLGSGVQSFGTDAHRWMQANAGRYGWHHPSWAQAGGSKPEPWHWEWAGPAQVAG